MKYLNILVLLFLVGFSTTTRAEKTFDCSEIIDGVFVVKNCTTGTRLSSYPIKGYEALPDIVKEALWAKNIAELRNKNGAVAFYEDEKFLSLFPPKKSVEKWSIKYDNNNFVIEKHQSNEFYTSLAIFMSYLLIMVIYSGCFYTSTDTKLPLSPLLVANSVICLVIIFSNTRGNYPIHPIPLDFLKFSLLMVGIEYAIASFRRYREQQEIKGKLNQN